MDVIPVVRTHIADITEVLVKGVGRVAQIAEDIEHPEGGDYLIDRQAEDWLAARVGHVEEHRIEISAAQFREIKDTQCKPDAQRH